MPHGPSGASYGLCGRGGSSFFRDSSSGGLGPAPRKPSASFGGASQARREVRPARRRGSHDPRGSAPPRARERAARRPAGLAHPLAAAFAARGARLSGGRRARCLGRRTPGAGQESPRRPLPARAPGRRRARRGARAVPRRGRAAAQAAGLPVGVALDRRRSCGGGRDRLCRADRAARLSPTVGPAPPHALPDRVPHRRDPPGRGGYAGAHRRGPTRAAGRHRDRAPGRPPVRLPAPPMDRDLIVAVSDLTCRYAGAPRDALLGVSLEVRSGEFHALLGPNGSGKPTLLRARLGLVPPFAGRAEILGRAATDWSRRNLARVVGVVPQREENLFPQRVHETVLLGRYPHLSLFGGLRAAARAAVDRALAACDAVDLADRWLWTLSGGEYQRVRLARALAQEPKLLVLDEPTASLDLRHEMELFELVRALVDRQGLAALMITHHVNLAARFADRVLILAEGRAVARGAPADVLTRETVERVFSWPVTIQPFDGRPQMIPLRQRKDAL